MVDLFPEELTPLIYTKTHYSEKQANILYLVFFFSVIEKKNESKRWDWNRSWHQILA